MIRLRLAAALCGAVIICVANLPAQTGVEAVQDSIFAEQIDSSVDDAVRSGEGRDEHSSIVSSRTDSLKFELRTTKLYAAGLDADIGNAVLLEAARELADEGFFEEALDLLDDVSGDTATVIDLSDRLFSEFDQSIDTLDFLQSGAPSEASPRAGGSGTLSWDIYGSVDYFLWEDDPADTAEIMDIVLDTSFDTGGIDSKKYGSYQKLVDAHSLSPLSEDLRIAMRWTPVSTGGLKSITPTVSIGSSRRSFGIDAEFGMLSDMLQSTLGFEAEKLIWQEFGDSSDNISADAGLSFTTAPRNKLTSITLPLTITGRNYSVSRRFYASNWRAEFAPAWEVHSADYQQSLEIVWRNEGANHHSVRTYVDTVRVDTALDQTMYFYSGTRDTFTVSSRDSAYTRVRDTADYVATEPLLRFCVGAGPLTLDGNGRYRLERSLGVAPALQRQVVESGGELRLTPWEWLKLSVQGVAEFEQHKLHGLLPIKEFDTLVTSSIVYVTSITDTSVHDSMAYYSEPLIRKKQLDYRLRLLEFSIRPSLAIVFGQQLTLSLFAEYTQENSPALFEAEGIELFNPVSLSFYEKLLGYEGGLEMLLNAGHFALELALAYRIETVDELTSRYIDYTNAPKQYALTQFDADEQDNRSMIMRLGASWQVVQWLALGGNADLEFKTLNDSGERNRNSYFSFYSALNF
ncbi:MAG: hypothetical protein GF398_14890 [Chitinivibrionales bacterium]|nr:hypothetical protein [Chitinivibrionales bacterium]